MLKSIPFYASLLGKSLGKIKAQNGHVLVYGAVEVHSFGVKGCIASNKLLAEETGLKENTVAKILSQLNSGGWITVTYSGAKHSARQNIIPNLIISIPTDIPAPVLPTGKTSLTYRYNQSYLQVNRGNSRDNSLDIAKNSFCGEADSEPCKEFDQSAILQKWLDGKNQAFVLIAKLIINKKLKFDSEEQLTVAAKRHLRAANQLKHFSNEQINTAIARIEKTNSRLMTDNEWTLETLLKYLTK